MAKGPTKAQLALTEAKDWIEASKLEVAEREAALVQARQQLEMHETIYAVLEKTLTRAPRNAAAKKAGKKATASTSATSRRGLPQTQQSSCVGFILNDGNQVTCNAPASDPIHDQSRGYAGYHEFQAAKATGVAGD